MENTVRNSSFSIERVLTLDREKLVRDITKYRKSMRNEVTEKPKIKLLRRAETLLDEIQKWREGSGMGLLGVVPATEEMNGALAVGGTDIADWERIPFGFPSEANDTGLAMSFFGRAELAGRKGLAYDMLTKIATGLFNRQGARDAVKGVLDSSRSANRSRVHMRNLTDGIMDLVDIYNANYDAMTSIGLKTADHRLKRINPDTDLWVRSTKKTQHGADSQQELSWVVTVSEGRVDNPILAECTKSFSLHFDVTVNLLCI